MVTNVAKTMAIRRAVSIKNASGTMLMSISVSGSRIQDPKVVVKKDMVENNEIPGKVCGYDGGQCQAGGEKNAGPCAEGAGDCPGQVCAPVLTAPFPEI